MESREISGTSFSLYKHNIHTTSVNMYPACVINMYRCVVNMYMYMQIYVYICTYVHVWSTCMCTYRSMYMYVRVGMHWYHGYQVYIHVWSTCMHWYHGYQVYIMCGLCIGHQGWVHTYIHTYMIVCGVYTMYHQLDQTTP